MDAKQFQKHTKISNEKLEMLKIWQNLLAHWNKRINLVANSTIYDFWLRHALDSWQIVERLPKECIRILDMGSGAGFPGLALGIALKNKPGTKIVLVEANGKKCNFLRTVIRELDLPAIAIQTRIENYEPDKTEAGFDVITARAFAPLSKLMEYSQPFWTNKTTAIFPKGESWADEVENAKNIFSFDLTTTPSQTSERATLLEITNTKIHNEHLK